MNENHKWDEQFVENITSFLLEKESEILHIWLDAANISPRDPFYEEVLQNGRQTVRLVHNYLRNPSEDQIILLTKKIAQERIEANVNIGEFVYNINLGRKILNDLFALSHLNKDDSIKAILAVNQIFDHYLYYAVKEYTEIKDRIITRKNQFIEEMHHDRLHVLGQIAASFAHEFRNPLTSIKGFLKLLQEEVYEKHSVYFSIMNQEMDSLEEKITQFLFLSKKKVLDDQMEQVNVSDVVKNMVTFMYPRFVDENIIAQSNIEPDCFISGVQAQLKQVFLNILSNAVDELSEVTFQREIKVVVKKNDERVNVDIINNGPEIPEHLLENIFEPFITTKELGVGLGLSVCKQIIEKHNGTISVTSNKNWTTFSLQFKQEK